MESAQHCPGCPYGEFGPAIGPRGDPTSRIVILGEAPRFQSLALRGIRLP